jgi:hypothetical protein
MRYMDQVWLHGDVLVQVHMSDLKLIVDALRRVDGLQEWTLADRVQRVLAEANRDLVA